MYDCMSDKLWGTLSYFQRGEHSPEFPHTSHCSVLTTQNLSRFVMSNQDDFK